MAGERVLIVENEVTMEARPLERFLKKHEFLVVGIAKDATKAVRMAREERPSLVLMDIMLPGDAEGGVKAARQIRNETGAAIIYVTGAETSQDLINKVAGTEPFGFLTKPWSEEQLLAVLKLFRAKSVGKKVVFVCYAHEDREMKNELYPFLKSLESVGVDAWDDERIRYGDYWKDEIDAAVRRADAAILLVSIDFMNSLFIQESELPQLLTLRERKGIPVFVVHIRSVPKATLQQKGLLTFQNFNDPNDPLAHWDRAEREKKAWTRICDELTRDRV